MDLNSNTTINDLPNDIFRYILRRLIVSPNMELYFFINKRINGILNNMSKKYKRDRHYCCIICNDIGYSPSYFPKKNLYSPLYAKNKNDYIGSQFRNHNLRILFDDICNTCLTSALPGKCNYCKIDFMMPKRSFKYGCINCFEKNNKKYFAVLKNYDTQISYLLGPDDVVCIKCKCKLIPYPIKYNINDIFCKDCYDKIKTDDKLIVLPEGFPYIINTYCPTKI
jgi:hypothetical protein